MVDVQSKLLPNLLTILAQLAATGILYLVYRKYLHEPVIRFLDAKADKLEEAERYAREVEETAERERQALAAQHQEEIQRMEVMRQNMQDQLEQEKKELLAQAQAERDAIMARTERQVERQKQDMLKEVEKQAVGLAATLTARVLSNYAMDEARLLVALEEEMRRLNETN